MKKFSAYPMERQVMWIAMGIMAAIIGVILLGFILQFLWNFALSPALNIPLIGFWQAVGIFLLAKLFFGFGASPGKGRRSRHRNKGSDRPDTRSQAFRSYWEHEGKAAFDAWSQSNEENSGSKKGEAD